MRTKKVVEQQIQKARNLIIAKIPFEKYINDNNLGHGSHEGKICCPVHIEHTPSLMYSDERHTYNCFGCGSKGSVLELHWNIKKLEDDSFTIVKAIYDLGRIYNLEIPDLYEYVMEKDKPKMNSASKRKRGIPTGEKGKEYYLLKIKRLDGNYNHLPLIKRFQIAYLIDNVLLGLAEPEESYKKIQREIQAVNNELIHQALCEQHNQSH